MAMKGHAACCMRDAHACTLPDPGAHTDSDTHTTKRVKGVTACRLTVSVLCLYSVRCESIFSDPTQHTFTTLYGFIEGAHTHLT